MIKHEKLKISRCRERVVNDGRKKKTVQRGQTGKDDEITKIQLPMSFNDNQRNSKNSVRRELKTGNTAVSWHFYHSQNLK